MKKKNVTILAVGDRSDYDSLKKFNKDRRLFLEEGFDYVRLSYKQALSGKVPEISTDKVIIFLFFPFSYWNRHIEHKAYKGIYGSTIFSRKFFRFCERMRRVIKKRLRGKSIYFINDPLRCALHRDKLIMKQRLSAADVLNPKLCRIGSAEEMRRRLNRGESFFLKPRCGSMGKGITFLSWENWQTNFIFRNERIISKKSDYGWRFRDITGNTAFLRQLMKKDIIIEKAIDVTLLNKRKVDLRVYTFFNKVLYVYPRKNHPDKVTTNITQGGKGDPAVLDIFPVRLITKAKKAAEKASKALDFNLAGVDVALDSNLQDVYVVDVNAFPGFPKRRTFNLTRHIIKEVARQLDRGKIPFKKASDL